MAIIARGVTPCVLCRQVLGANDDILGTQAFGDDPHEFIAAFADTGFHQACFDTWALRRVFIDRHNALSLRGRFEGEVVWMAENGSLSRYPVQDVPPPPPDAHLLVIELPSSRRRPTLHAAINPTGEDRSGVRLVLSVATRLEPTLLVAASPALTVALLHRNATGQVPASLSLHLLPEAPAELIRAADGPGNFSYVEARLDPGGHLAGDALLAIRIDAPLLDTALRCWALCEPLP